MINITEILEQTDNIVWGIPLIVLIMAVGIYFTVRMRVTQFRFLGKALKFLFEKDKEDSAKGEISSFAALCTSLSATIGTGNIVGVATAIGVLAGGPGALLWMWIAAFFGMATKYAEGFLAIKYRKVNKDGTILGGPFYYIEYGMGEKWKWLGKLFALFGMLAGLLGIGTIAQVNGIASAAKTVFDPDSAQLISVFGCEYSLVTVLASLVITLLAALVIIGGLKRISAVSEKIVPFMAVVYVGVVIIILITNITKIPAAIVEIFAGAFGIRPIAGGMFASILISLKNGVARGIFSNEAGLGSAPIASSAAKSDDPVRQGLISMTGTFFDTILICTMTGLTITMMGSWKDPALEGANVSIDAFTKGLWFLPSSIPPIIVSTCLAFFAFTTILGWNLYGEKCTEYLTSGNKKAVYIYRILYIFMVFFGPYMTVTEVWTLADILNGLMAIPNLIALAALSGIIIKETNEYLRKC
jgi:AGCS family alanine or glycine:cation symporter